MRKTTRRDSLKLALAAPLVMVAGRLRAQGSWPSAPVIVTVAFAPGGGADTAARAIFAKVSEVIKQPVVIDNRPAGASVVAASYVRSRPNDGYTWLFNGTQHVIVPILLKNIDFDYNTTFVPVTQCCSYVNALAVAADSPYKTIEDLIADAKAKPGRLRCGTAISGSNSHLAMVEFQNKVDVKFVHVPYRVATEGPRDLVGGQLDALSLTLSTLTPMLQAKRLRILAVTTLARSKAQPDVPTVAERGYPGFDMGDWGGLFAVSGTPQPIIEAMQQAVAAAAADQRVLSTLVPIGTEPVGSSPSEFAAFLGRQRETLTRVVKDANLSLG